MYRYCKDKRVKLVPTFVPNLTHRGPSDSANANASTTNLDSAEGLRAKPPQHKPRTLLLTSHTCDVDVRVIPDLSVVLQVGRLHDSDTGREVQRLHAWFIN